MGCVWLGEAGLAEECRFILGVAEGSLEAVVLDQELADVRLVLGVRALGMPVQGRLQPCHLLLPKVGPCLGGSKVILCLEQSILETAVTVVRLVEGTVELPNVVVAFGDLLGELEHFVPLLHFGRLELQNADEFLQASNLAVGLLEGLRQLRQLLGSPTAIRQLTLEHCELPLQLLHVAPGLLQLRSQTVHELVCLLELGITLSR